MLVHPGILKTVLGAVSAALTAGRTDMVSWIYSETYVMIIWTGVTISMNFGPNTLKMVLVTFIQ